MTPAEFKLKWSRFQSKETSGYAEHFNDLCVLLGQPTPAEADPNGTVQEKDELTNAAVDQPEKLHVLRAMFGNPDELQPRHATAEIIEKLAAKIAEVAKSLQKCESVEIAVG